jgi:hypothetical protein
MKKYFIFFSLTSLLLLGSCAVSKDAGGKDDFSGIEGDLLRNAIESGKFIVKLERIYNYRGMLELNPSANYIIVDGEKATINAAYMGRQYGFRPVAGINMRGTASEYEITKKENKDQYNIKLRVENEKTSFDVNLVVTRNGSTSVSISGLRIDNAQYRGFIAPLTDKVDIPQQGKEII